ncbi:Retinoblastoma-like protein 2 [Chelonia mydas]|uniref:Retinoblastoma-like protein 2 n=1 Tax=Chelonia mydas TaxID=8469 RepID=M7C9H0_CHEMY|nr:Retinoblastoma-like protein 2 [Chelonia mydas]
MASVFHCIPGVGGKADRTFSRILKMINLVNKEEENRGNFPMISDDLVNSYHLLLCALDLVYGNALQCPNRRELLNPTFKGLPEDFHSKDYKPSSDPPCIIEKLCSLHDGLVLDAKGIKEHFWKPYIRKLFDKKILKGKEENLTGFLDPGSFGDSFKAINKAYEEYVLSVGNLDERIFLGEDADEEIGTLRRCLNTASGMETAERVQMKYNLQQHFDRHSSLATSDKTVSSTRVGTQYQIQCGSAQQAPTPEEPSPEREDNAGKHFRLAEVLYYKVLESVIEQERRRLGDTDLSVIEIFIRAEDGLCREVVKHLNHIEEQILESMAWKRESPLWDRIRDNENKVPTCEEVMPPHYFERSNGNSLVGSPLTPRRISEVRAETGGLGKGLSSSPTTLYDRYSSPTTNPTRRRLFVDNDNPPDSGTPVRVSQQPVVNTVPVQNVTPETMSVTPVPGQTLVTVATATVTANNGQTVTIPVQGIANENGGITFFPVQVNVGGQAQAVSGSIQPLSAQTLAGGTLNTQMSGAALQLPGQVAVQQISPPGDQQRQNQQFSTISSSKPRKTGSLCLFFRKVYHLASVRLRDLCVKLDISDELRKKIWTCFEFSLVQCPELMMDRHLDQLLMCAVYVMAKVTKEDKSFQNIMRCYRTQPQARSHVYRAVLIKGRRPRHRSGSSDSSIQQNSPTERSKDRTSRDSSPVMRSSSTLPVPQPNSAPPTPTRLTGTNSDIEEEERGDLIRFYNNIYIEHMKEFALKYSSTNATDAPPLSPYPFVRIGSPRRIQLSQNHSIYISPHKNESTLSPREKIFYYFSSSPSKISHGVTENPSKTVTQTRENVLLRHFTPRSSIVTEKQR